MDTEKALHNLLAVIHRDGGNYVGQHGTEKAVTDAIKKIALLLEMEDIMAEFTARHKIWYVGTPTKGGLK